MAPEVVVATIKHIIGTQFVNKLTENSKISQLFYGHHMKSFMKSYRITMNRGYLGLNQGESAFVSAWKLIKEPETKKEIIIETVKDHTIAVIRSFVPSAPVGGSLPALTIVRQLNDLHGTLGDLPNFSGVMYERMNNAFQSVMWDFVRGTSNEFFAGTPILSGFFKCSEGPGPDQYLLELRVMVDNDDMFKLLRHWETNHPPGGVRERISQDVSSHKTHSYLYDETTQTLQPF